MAGESLSNQLLIAMPALADPNFARTVTYICEHNGDGALGIVINRPLDLSLGDILGHLEMQVTDPDVGSQPVLMGGPVQTERGFILHQPLGAWEATLPVTAQIGLTTSQDILRDMAMGRGPGQSLVALGYAGWGAGQLEREMLENAWLSGPADESILFDLPYSERWEAAAARLGIDLNLLSDQAGHA
jgi:putative transcriptional regulator